jgi:hypothetical protein
VCLVRVDGEKTRSNRAGTDAAGGDLGAPKLRRAQEYRHRRNWL